MSPAALSASSFDIVLPVFNGEAYVAEAIESVMAQTAQDWRLLVIDDGSRDRSLDVVRQWRDARIRVCTQEKNLGLYPTLKRSIPQLTREWVVILMQDDRLKPSYLESMAAVADAHPDAAGIWATEDTIDAAGRVIAAGRSSTRVEVIEPGLAPWHSALRRGCIWTISGSCTRRSLFVQEPFREDLPHCADFEWFLRTVRTHQFVYVDRPLADVRRHGEQASAVNLNSGRDVVEGYAVIRENMGAHGAELSLAAWAAICGGRTRLALRRAAAAVLRRQWAPAKRFLACSAGFAGLSVRRALGTRPSGRTPGRAGQAA